MIGMPAIVIGHEGNSRVADLGLSRQFSFLKVGHSNDRHAPRTIDLGFSSRRERRSFHAQIGSAPVNGDSVDGGSSCFFEHVAEVSTYRIGKTSMGGYSVTKESGCAVASAVKELVWQDYVQRLQLLFEGADRARRDDPFHAQQFHAVDVGPEWDFSGNQPVALSVPGQKCHARSAQLTKDEVIRGATKRRVYRDLFYLGERCHLVYSTSAYDPDLRLSHSESPPSV